MAAAAAVVVVVIELGFVLLAIAVHFPLILTMAAVAEAVVGLV